MKHINAFFGLAIIVLSAVLVTGCSVSSTSQVMKPGERKSGFLNLSKTAEILVDNPKGLQNQSDKVIIGSFKIGFVTDNKAQSVTKGIGAHGKATAMAHLIGLTPEDMQKIVNQAYQDFIAALKAKGYTVLSTDELAAVPEYVALQDAGVASPEPGVVANIILEGKTTYVAPEGMKVVHYIGEKKALFDISTVTIIKSQELSEKTGATVLSVHYLMSFLNADMYSGMTASVKVGQGLSIIPGSSVTYYKGKNTMPTAVKLGQAVYSEDEFAKIQKITNGAMKTLGILANVASAYMGGATSQSEVYNFTIEPESYTKAAVDITTRTNQKLINKIAEGRPVPVVPAVGAQEPVVAPEAAIK